MSAELELKHDSAPTTAKRWGPRPADTRTAEERRAESEGAVLEQRQRIAAEGSVETPAGLLRVPVVLESEAFRRLRVDVLTGCYERLRGKGGR